MLQAFSSNKSKLMSNYFQIKPGKLRIDCDIGSRNSAEDVDFVHILLMTLSLAVLNSVEVLKLLRVDYE